MLIMVNLTMKSWVRIPTELNNTMQYALIPNYARRMELPLVAPPAQGAGYQKKRIMNSALK